MVPSLRFTLGNGVKCLLLCIALATIGLSDKLSEEKSHCTADSCDTNGEQVILNADEEEEKESGVHLAYYCSEPQFVPEEGVPVIMLHGLTDTRHTWNGIYQNIPVLTHRKACVYDARNHGDSGWNETLSIDALAEDLKDFMDMIKCEKAILVGHSMGGMTAMRFALKNPSRVEGLFIEDMHPSTIAKEGWTFVSGWLSLLEKGISLVPEKADDITAKKIVSEFLQEIVPVPLPDSFTTYIPLIQRDGVWQWKMNQKVINKIFEDEGKNFLGVYEGQYDGKAFFIYGKVSVFKVGDKEEEIKTLFPNSELFGVEGADHDIHSLHSEFTTELIRFLNNVSH